MYEPLKKLLTCIRKQGCYIDLNYNRSDLLAEFKNRFITVRSIQLGFPENKYDLWMSQSARTTGALRVTYKQSQLFGKGGLLLKLKRVFFDVFI